MVVNGKEKKIPSEISLNEFLSQEGYDTQKVAVEKNGCIVPKKSFATEMLSSSDKLEIVCFVGGG
ncbi:MAG: sulfur carrier protein ThiS [Spirochaetaceae bacterium]|nr:sulfur carrier protein ThiS [Spirochaetaceae bacterium]